MNSNFFTYENNDGIYKVCWRSNNGVITVNDTSELSAFLSKDKKKIVIERWKNKILDVYSLDGNILGEIFIKEDAWIYRGINCTDLSSSGIAVIVTFKDDISKSQFCDDFQLEVDVENMKIERVLGVYR